MRDGAPHVLVVGSGAAGLTAALSAAAHGARVTVATKSGLGHTATDRAQGGIAAMTRDLPGGQPLDSPELHARDTEAAGAGLCDAEVVRGVVADSARAVTFLTGLGVEFDRVAGPGSRWVQGLEGAHSVPRILHAGGDATGHAMQAALVAAVRAAEAQGTVLVREYTVATRLVVSDGAVSGAAVRPVARNGSLGSEEVLEADHVVLATGGAGQLHPFTTNPAVATGDGIALALRAGAAVRDLEFLQFHPTALAAPGSFLISEAVRGEGAVLRNGRGERFMVREHPLAELAPRDVVARAIAAERAASPDGEVFLDCTGIPAPDGMTRSEFLARRFPTIDRALRAHGIDWSREPVPVSPAAHYLMGGVTTDPVGRTSVPGLWAAGECATTGLHGANRLASNSLLEAVVLGERTGRLAATEPVDPDSWTGPLPCRAGGTAGTGSSPRSVPRTPEDRPAAPVADRAGPGDGPFSRAALQDIMWREAGVVRTAGGLGHARATLERWLAAASDARSHGTLAEHEDLNLLTVALALVRAAQERTGSRGAHHRADHPGHDGAVPEETGRTGSRPGPAAPHHTPHPHERTVHAEPLSR